MIWRIDLLPELTYLNVLRIIYSKIAILGAKFFPYICIASIEVLVLFALMQKEQENQVKNTPSDALIEPNSPLYAVFLTSKPATCWSFQIFDAVQLVRSFYVWRRGKCRGAHDARIRRQWD